MNAELKEIKIRFQAGDLTSCDINANSESLGGGYYLQFFSLSQSQPIALASQRQGKTGLRLFKTIDAAFSVARDIGFKKAFLTS